jgi:glucosyl-dolichyl phosphate glucuronosyltransferase
MTLDLVVPTYNRSWLLKKTLASVEAAEKPENLRVTLVVVDNNSPDDTAEVVHTHQQQASVPVVYVQERKQGLSHARNAGISASTADLVGFIDDDEELHPLWFQVVAREFSDPDLQFIGGPYLANWVCEIPDWLPPGYPSVIGAIPPKPRSVFSKEFGANLMGGNAVIRRSVFDKIGMYAPHLGRSSKGLLSEEDAEFYRRLESAGMKGMYVPDLAIHHYIDPKRLTRTYHRRWVYWRAVSQGLLDRELREPVPYLAGIPRYRYGKALRAVLSMPGHRIGPQGKGRAFADELTLWDMAGFVYGKFFFDAKTYYAEQQKS